MQSVSGQQEWVYNLKELLPGSTFGQVRKATHIVFKDEVVAIRAIPYQSESERKQLFEEARKLRKLIHSSHSIVV
jgi:serine/threonine protein kinase